MTPEQQDEVRGRMRTLKAAIDSRDWPVVEDQFDALLDALRQFIPDPGSGLIAAVGAHLHRHSAALLEMEDVTVGNENRFLADACDELAAAFIGTTAALRSLAAQLGRGGSHRR